eukprot:9478408-Pyramimonas_sp.AAC.1
MYRTVLYSYVSLHLRLTQHPSFSLFGTQGWGPWASSSDHPTYYVFVLGCTLLYRTASNVLVDLEVRPAAVRLCDFSVAFSRGVTEAGLSLGADDCVGSLRWMAPEVRPHTVPYTDDRGGHGGGATAFGSLRGDPNESISPTKCKKLETDERSSLGSRARGGACAAPRRTGGGP